MEKLVMKDDTLYEMFTIGKSMETDNRCVILGS